MLRKGLADDCEMDSAKNFLPREDSALQKGDVEDGEVFGADQIEPASAALVEGAANDLHGLKPVVVGRNSYSGDRRVCNSGRSFDLLDERVVVVHPLPPIREGLLRQVDPEREYLMAVEAS